MLTTSYLDETERRARLLGHFSCRHRKYSNESLTVLTLHTHESNSTEMSLGTPSPSTTPSRLSAVSPVQWMRAFAYTPDSALVQKNGDKHPLATIDSEDRMPRSDDDALPTRFHPRARSRGAVSGVLNLGRGSVSLGDRSDTNVSDPSLSVPAKRLDRDRDAPSSSTSSMPDCLTRRRTTKTRMRCRSAMGGSEHDQDPSPSHAPAPRSGRVVLDVVEGISKKRLQNRTADLGTVRAGYPTESAHEKASSYYPSPPVSRADRDVSMHDEPSPHILYPDTVECEGCLSPEPALPLKTSKYFAHASAPPTSPVPKHFSVLTPPSAPMITIPVYIESSDFEYLPLDVSFDEPVEGTVDESSTPTWFNNPGLFDDLMIMLRRLKPILVQGGFRLYYYIGYE